MMQQRLDWDRYKNQVKNKYRKRPEVKEGEVDEFRTANYRRKIR